MQVLRDDIISRVCLSVCVCMAFNSFKQSKKSFYENE